MTNTTPAQSGLIGIIGLGHIGLAIAGRLLESGHAVIGYRRSGGEALQAIGGTGARSVGEVVEACRTIFIALPNEAASADVLEAILHHRADGRTLIDVTSMTPHTAIAHAERAVTAGYSFIEAPINGAATAVRAHKGTMLVGGDPSVIDAHRAILEDVAGKIIEVGEIGGPNAIKAGTLMMMAINTLGLAEAVAYAERFGVSPAIAIDAYRDGPAASAALSFRGPAIASREYAARLGGLGELHTVLDGFRAATETPNGLLRQTLDYIATAIAAGHAESDLAAVYEIMRPER